MSTEQIISLCALLVSVFAMLANGKKDTRQDAAKSAAENARVEAKLDGISDGVTDIRAEMRSMRNTVHDHGERLSKVEGSASSAHHRLDELETLFHKAHPPQ